MFDPFTRKRIKKITCVKFKEESLMDVDPKGLENRIKLKKAVINILIKIQAFKWMEKIKRTQKSKVAI